MKNTRRTLEELEERIRCAAECAKYTGDYSLAAVAKAALKAGKTG